MKNKILFVLISVTTLTSLHSCKDIISPSLRNKSLTILAPTNNFISKSSTILFWWEVIDDADNYTVQIIKPSFTAGQQLIVDTIVSGNKYSQNLQPGTYQWRVRGQNSTSYTDYVTYNLTIDSTLDLSNQTLLLNSPSDNFYVNKLTVAFSWIAMTNATEYIFRLFNNLDIQIGNSQPVSGTDLTYTFPSEGTFKWRVSSLNNQSGSPYTERTITIDTTRPNIPTITFNPLNPLNDTTSLKPVPLTWSIADNNAKFKIQISTDSFLTTNYIVDTTTLELKYKFRKYILNTRYFWRISAIDSATNQSAYSAIHRFKVK